MKPEFAANFIAIHKSINVIASNGRIEMIILKHDLCDVNDFSLFLFGFCLFCILTY